ncbi:MAG: FeoA family protein [Candidatus Neomarinimicrobiota bacterium]
MSLGDLKPGETGIIAGFSGVLELQSRLVEMGLLKGTFIKLIKKTPFNGPLEIKVRDYYVSLRLEDARHILLSK